LGRTSKFKRSAYVRPPLACGVERYVSINKPISKLIFSIKISKLIGDHDIINNQNMLNLYHRT
jgi:hypothetical protein